MIRNKDNNRSRVPVEDVPRDTIAQEERLAEWLRNKLL